MQVEVTLVDEATARLDVTIEADEVDRAIEATYRRLAQRIKVPGFRPGKAPKSILLRTFGEDDFYHQATDEGIRRWYPQALRESGVQALDSGRLEERGEDSHVVPAESFTFVAVVPVVPEIQLPDYGEIKIPPPPTLVTEEDVDKVIEEVRLARATLEPAPAKAAALGDVVKMNIHGKAGGDDVVAREDFDYELVETERERTFPGLSKELTGARPGDIRDMTLALPDDYEDADLEGKSLLLNIVVKAIQRKVLPELNDELVQEISSSKTVSELRHVIRHNIEHEKNEEAINKVAGEVVDSLIARTNPPAPETLVAEAEDRMLRDQKRYLEQGGMRFDQFLIAARKSEDEYRADLRPSAERAVKRDLLLDAVAKAENLEPVPADVDLEVKRMSASVSRSERDFERLSESRRLHDVVAEEMRRRAALTKLVEMTSGLKPLVHPEDEAEGAVDGTGDDEVREPEPAGAVAGS